MTSSYSWLEVWPNALATTTRKKSRFPLVFGLHLREAAQDEDVANLERHGLDGFLGSLGASPGDTCDKRERLCRVVGARRLQEEVHVLKHLAKGIAAAVEGHRPKGIHGATRRRERLRLLPRNDIRRGSTRRRLRSAASGSGARGQSREGNRESEWLRRASI